MINKSQCLTSCFGMVGTFSDTKKNHIWTESQQGLMATGTLIPMV
jgi:hypothetical protein